MPGIDTIAQVFSKLRPFGGLGEDYLGSELFKCAPLHLARLHHSVVVKSILTIHPPIHWKGGIMFELYKGDEE